MAFPSLEQSLDKVSNRYLLVTLACKRARQIKPGAAARVVSKASSENNCMIFKARSVRWGRGCQALPGQVQSLGADVDGARAADLGSHGSPGRGVGRHRRSGARDGNLLFHDSARAPRVDDETVACARPDPASGRWPQEDGRQRSDPPDRSRGAGGADRLGRSDGATSLELA